MGENMKLHIEVNNLTKSKLIRYNMLGRLFYVKIVTKSKLPKGFYKYTKIDEFISLN